MRCPDCGYMMSDFDTECTRCAKFGKPPAKVVPAQPMPVMGTPPVQPPLQVVTTSLPIAYCQRCGSEMVAGSAFCPRCGVPVASTGQPIIIQNIMPQPLASAQAHEPADTGMIVTMWLLSFGSVMMFFAHVYLLWFLLDVGAFVLAIMLVRKDSPADKGNGWAKLALEIVGVIIAIAGAAASSGS